MEHSPTTKRELDTVLSRLVIVYGAERVILFGSSANGTADADSDVDLVVIKETPLPFFDRLREVAGVCKWTHGFDVLVYTPAEFAEMSRSSKFVREEILEKGTVLYDRAA